MTDGRKPRRALVTGGCGFIGTHLTRWLLEEGYDVVVLDDLSTGRLDSLPDDAKFVGGCVTRQTIVWDLIAECDEVYHLAAVASVPACEEDPRRARRVNVAGTCVVMEGATYLGKGAILASSCAVERGQSVYAQTKSLAELATTRNGHTYLRFHNVYGEGQPNTGAVIPAFITAAIEGHPARIQGDGKQSRDFIHVSDVIRALRAALWSGDSFEVGTGKSIDIEKLWLLVRAETVGLGLDDPGAPEFGEARSGDVRAAVTAKRWPGCLPLAEGIRGLLRDRM